GFQWIDFMDWQQGIISFLRKSRDGHEWMLACFNFTPIPRHFYRVGVPADGFWGEALNSDAHCYGGSGVGNWGGLNADPVWSHGHPHSLNMSLPPLGMVCMKRTFPRE
ncbi:MAG: alpha amylase C-terminal domain-containing protein, partial [Verrucomicrobiae bacterium]|nr:alpha amylase C-terminal domain-containing protein [Verrucomicrobiae bacterium]